jgi:hypothetical protein
MKLRTLLGMTLVGVMLTTPAWAHHAAEGIISDEMWEDINDRLVAAESPHLVIFEDIMGSMRIDEADEGGSMFLVSSITVDEADCDYYVGVIQGVLDDVELDWTHDPNGDTNGAYSNTFMPVLYEDENGDSCICEDDECTIALWEPIGSIGWSDDADEIYDPPEAPGPGKK